MLVTVSQIPVIALTAKESATNTPRVMVYCIIRTMILRAMVLFFVFAINRRSNAQLISFSMLHHIDNATLVNYNLTHPDDFDLALWHVSHAEAVCLAEQK